MVDKFSPKSDYIIGKEKKMKRYLITTDVAVRMLESMALNQKYTMTISLLPMCLNCKKIYLDKKVCPDCGRELATSYTADCINKNNYLDKSNCIHFVYICDGSFYATLEPAKNIRYIKLDDNEYFVIGEKKR